jgi:[FeFe] hydrogenase H-cluster maturation GTPase HydF
MNETPQGSRLHIAILGRRNVGKSSLINALTNQDIALVSTVAGTTTDPVYKAMEILPIGPVMIIDTAGIDDVGELGTKRVEKSMKVLTKADMALLVIDGESGIADEDKALLKILLAKKIPTIAVANKSDLYELNSVERSKWESELGISLLIVSAAKQTGIDKLKQVIIKEAPAEWEGSPIIGDLVTGGDTVILVVPIDLAAPKGRLILPQVQTIRDLLDHDAFCLVVKERELKAALDNLKTLPKLVVTDSQEFLKVAADTPKSVSLTSFSILFARHKGDLNTLVEGACAIDDLQIGDKILIAEGCTHHQQADDIGHVKIPRWLRQAVGGELQFDWASGSDFPTDLSSYQLIVHCGSCMLNRREMLHRLAVAREYDVPIVNYGVLIAHIHGILGRALSPFPLAQLIYEEGLRR